MKTQKGFMLVHFSKQCVNLDLWANTEEELQDALASLVSKKKDAKIVPYYKENNMSYLEISKGNFLWIG